MPRKKKQPRIVAVLDFEEIIMRFKIYSYTRQLADGAVITSRVIMVLFWRYGEEDWRYSLALTLTTDHGVKSAS